MNFFKKLRALNIDRCRQCFFPLEDWNVLEWAGAACGEAGEMANIAKKIRRSETMGIEVDPGLKGKLADEISDVIVYLDLLCASQGIDLELAIANKFNEVSKRVGYEEAI